MLYWSCACGSCAPQIYGTETKTVNSPSVSVYTDFSLRDTLSNIGVALTPITVLVWGSAQAKVGVFVLDWIARSRAITGEISTTRDIAGRFNCVAAPTATNRRLFMPLVRSTGAHRASFPRLGSGVSNTKCTRSLIGKALVSKTSRCTFEPCRIRLI